MTMGVTQEGVVRDTIRVRRGRGVGGLDRGDRKVAITKDAPGPGRGIKAELSEHTPELSRCGLRAPGVPRRVDGEDTQRKPVRRGRRDDDIKGNHATSETVRDWDSLALKVVPDSGNNPPLGRMGRGTNGRGLIDVVRRHRHTRRHRWGRLRFLNNPDVGTRRYDMVPNSIRLHDVVQTVRIKRE